jgi:hypothetical protein
MVRTLEEIQADPARVRVTVDVELSQVGTAAQANRIQVLEGELEAALEKVRLYDVDRHTEQRRADEFRAELERRTSERDEREAARRKLEEGANLALNERNTANRKLEAGRAVLNAPSVRAALDRLEDSESGYVQVIADAVRQALATMDAA